MRTIKSDFLRSYDKFKDDVFHSKKEEFKANLRSKEKKPDVVKLKLSFPWRTLTKLSTLVGVVYLAYNYTESLVEYTIRRNIMTTIDLISLKVLKEDALVKIKTLIKHPQ